MLQEGTPSWLQWWLSESTVRQWLVRAKLRLAYPESGYAIYLARAIQGWLSDREANQLYKLAKNETPDLSPVVVEVGCWKGKSSSVIAAGLWSKSGAQLFCIDPFGQDENSEYQERYYSPLLLPGEDILDVFRRNMQNSGVAHIITPVKGYSFEAVKGWQLPIDLLFIDANHEYEAVTRDFVLWSPFVKAGGIVALHDTFGQWPGPTRVVKERLVPPEYGDIHRADTLAWAHKI